jgi:hypothetical protein
MTAEDDRREEQGKDGKMAECGALQRGWPYSYSCSDLGGGGCQLSWPRRPPTSAEITDVSRASVPLRSLAVVQLLGRPRCRWAGGSRGSFVD